MSASQNDSAILFDYIVYTAPEAVMLKHIHEADDVRIAVLDASITGVSTLSSSFGLGMTSITRQLASSLILTPANWLSSSFSTLPAVTVVITLSTPIATATSIVYPAKEKSTSSSRREIAVIASSVGGGVVIFILSIVVVLIYRRRRRLSALSATEVFLGGKDSANELEREHTTGSGSSCLPCIRPPSYDDTQTVAETLASAVSPVPSEVDHVYRQLEELSSEVESIRRRETSSDFKASGDLAVSGAPTRTVQDDIERLREEIYRLKQRLPDVEYGLITSDGPLRPFELLRDLALLRGEIEELLHDQNSDGSAIERLPSYSSRRATSTTQHAEECPPPVPSIPTEYER